MTPEQQRIAIAEACGWKKDSHHPRTYRLDNGYIKFAWAKSDGRGHDEPPNYLSDLNAMHEAVHSRITSPELQQEYFYQLNDAIGLVDCFSPAWIKEFAVFAHSQATAAQRAEAFLRTLNLWPTT